MPGDTESLCRFLDTPNCQRDGWWTNLYPQILMYDYWGGTPNGCQANAMKGAAPNGAPAEELAGPIKKFMREALPQNDLSNEGCGPRHYSLASAAKDGKFEHLSFFEYRKRETHSYNSDIVLVDGKFIQMPGGKQNSDSSE